MPKNKITPHKGGRSATLKVRIRPEVLEELRRRAKESGVSQADIIEALLFSWNDPFDGWPERDGDYWIYDEIRGFKKASYTVEHGFYTEPAVRFWAHILSLPRV